MTLHQGIDERRFANIGAADEGILRQIVLRQQVELGVTGNEMRILDDHGIKSGGGV